jgi:hypothetical protein
LMQQPPPWDLPRITLSSPGATCSTIRPTRQYLCTKVLNVWMGGWVCSHWRSRPAYQRGVGMCAAASTTANMPPTPVPASALRAAAQRGPPRNTNHAQCSLKSKATRPTYVWDVRSQGVCQGHKGTDEAQTSGSSRL